LLGWDERITPWRMRHYLTVARVIGDSVVGTQGTPVELLGGLIKQRFGALAGAQPADRTGERGAPSHSTCQFRRFRVRIGP
jgi:hypothetical protein